MPRKRPGVGCRCCGSRWAVSGLTSDEKALFYHLLRSTDCRVYYRRNGHAAIVARLFQTYTDKPRKGSKK